jgi:hypothetical protein
MANTSITTKALTYRDPTVSAAAAVQLRRNRQQSFDALVNQAEQTSDAASRITQLDRNKADSFQAAQDAADQTAEENSTTQNRRDAVSLSASTDTDGHQPAVNDDDQEQSETAETGQSHQTAAFSAQQIAQEQLGIGLHLPPLQPADEAYRRAGAEPPLVTEDAASTLFAVAV